MREMKKRFGIHTHTSSSIWVVNGNTVPDPFHRQHGLETCHSIGKCVVKLKHTHTHTHTHTHRYQTQD